MKKSISDKKLIGNEAVSPVVGVMLMLVVTIIIAGVVSAFAGGLAETTDKAPQVSLKATFSQTDGLAISHQGGDAIGTIDTVALVRLGDTFGDSGHMAWTVNATTILSKRGAIAGSKDAWFRNDGYSGVKSFAPGDNAYIEYPYFEPQFLQPSSRSKAYNFTNPENVGKTFWLEFSDKSGKTFAKTEVIIAP